MTTLIDNLDDLARSGITSCILLYSGGLDGSYFLNWAKRHTLDVLALTIGIDDDLSCQEIKRTAQGLNAPFLYKDCIEQFVNEYVVKAIKANAYYQGLYPVCSSLSRPLFSRVAVQTAHEMGVQAIIHTSTYMQNSATRFNLSLMGLDPNITIAAPFLRSHFSREEKLHSLEDKGLSFPLNIYSIDKNIWGRVIECGTLENPENRLPDSGVFTWTRDITDTPNSAEEIEIAFEGGVPTVLNGQPSNVIDIVRALNILGGKHGIGRFSGLEDTVFGVKNHEIRESPAAHILITAHRELEAAVLTQSELSLKLFLDNYWTNLIVSGSWYAHLTEALFAFIDHMNELVNGKVRLKLHKGNLIVQCKSAEKGLYYAKFEADFAARMEQTAFAPFYTSMGIPLLRRQKSENL